MILMAAMGVLLVVGLVLVVRLGATEYASWDPASGDAASAEGPVDVRPVALRYLRGAAVGLVGGFWAGALVTGPAVRLIMRLLAVTAGDDAQGRLTEAREVVGDINFGDTLGLYVFGGLLAGLLSGGIYMIVRRWLPGGWLGGVTFGLLHLVVAATRIDPLRPGNSDFDLVGPGWLAVVTFGLASVLHGMAVASIANGFSVRFPRQAPEPGARWWSIAPLVLPGLVMIPAVVLLIPVGIGLGVTVIASQVPPIMSAVRSRSVLIAGRVVMVAFGAVMLPGAVSDVHDVMVREDVSALAQVNGGAPT